MKLALQQINTSQVTEDDLNRLRESSPSDCKGLVFSTTDSEFGFIALISEEDEYRQSDFAEYSPAMKRAVEWAHCQGASYLMICPDCEMVDFDASSDNASTHYDEVMEAVR